MDPKTTQKPYGHPWGGNEIRKRQAAIKALMHRDTRRADAKLRDFSKPQE